MNDNTSVMNVDGASVSEALLAANETRDIVLPNQTEHVAHIAIDVSQAIVFFMHKCNK
jgi:type II pantothenate kinase